jgi:MoxR-like ATPase
MSDDVAGIARLAEACQQLRQEIARVVVGQQDVVEQLLIGLLASGHCLLVGVPGLAKTLMVRTLADALDLTFSRIQFTPDLMPSDITGSDVLYEDRAQGTRQLRFVPGPIFANLVLADEINRTPPKTQAALLEAMQERQVTAGGQKHALPQPFFVLATQNPIEQEGTYPLPEAQLDRFMLQIQIGYPSVEDELFMIKRTTSDFEPTIGVAMRQPELHEFTRLVRRVPVSDPIARYALQLVRLTRPQEPDSPDIVRRNLRWGAGPRAGQFLLLAAKARAAVAGRYTPSEQDLQAVVSPVLRHRLRLTYSAEAEGITVDDIINRLPQLVHTGNADELARTGLVRPSQAG